MTWPMAMDSLQGSDNWKACMDVSVITIPNVDSLTVDLAAEYNS